MLQQTQALRVVPYYERWLARFPSVGVLADAPTRDVLALWSGLGYNRRALALQRAAAVVAADGWPSDLTALPGRRALHGGRGRVVRVGPAGGGGRHERAARAGAPRRRGADAARAGRARGRRLLPAGRAATFNQAMMELGATVCRPRVPACGACPVAPGCHGPLPGGAAAPGARSASRTPTAGRADGCSRRCSRAKSRRCRANARERALAGLERDGLIVRGADGSFRLP